MGGLSLDGERTLHSGGPCGAPGGWGERRDHGPRPAHPSFQLRLVQGRVPRAGYPSLPPARSCFSHASVCRDLCVSSGLSLQELGGTPVVLQGPVVPGDTSAPGAPAQLGRNQVCWTPNCYTPPVAGCPLRCGAVGESLFDLASRQTGASEIVASLGESDPLLWYRWWGFFTCLKKQVYGGNNSQNAYDGLNYIPPKIRTQKAQPLGPQAVTVTGDGVWRR